MDKFQHFQRRVFFDHEHGASIVRIERHNDRPLYMLLLGASTGAFVFFCLMFVRILLRHSSAETVLALSPFIALMLVWYIIGLRKALWRSFGTERIVIHGGIFQWNRTALCWKRNIELPTSDITNVKAVTPWHGLSNHVEFAARGKRRVLGDMLLRYEAVELAKKLHKVVGPGE